ncbi:MAG: HAD family hydrolase, partial [Deltaproteobacteria bacterium CG_4_9_14_3_um_filter_44_9]
MDSVAIWDTFLKNAKMKDETARRNLAVILAQLFRGISRKRLFLYPEAKGVLDSLRP